MPEARVAFVEALGRLHGLSDPEATVREQLLIRLAGDGQFGVRRAASRVFAEVEPVRYEALLASWAAGRNQDTAERRRQAAEGTLWVRSSGALDQLRELEWDREEAVRKAYQRATDDRREAGWREFHESHVLAATAAGDVVRMWRHGWALGRLGDDRTIERLNQRASTDLPANVRFWVERVRKEVQGRWDDVVRKWPEPWYARRGRYEVVDGTILWADGSSTGIQAHLWVDVGDRPSGLAGWGGWGDLDGSTRASWLKRSFTRLGHGGEDQLLIPGRAPARILVTSSLVPDGRIVFTGNSFYPQEGNASDPA
jgi:hypothetical protein